MGRKIADKILVSFIRIRSHKRKNWRMEKMLSLLLVLLLCILSCEEVPLQNIQGHWYGFSENGRYYELVIDSNTLKHFESYRLEEPFFIFPKSSTHIQQEAEHWQISFPDSQFIHLRLKNDSCLQFINPENQQILEAVFRFPVPAIPTPHQDASITESKPYRTEFIQREVAKLSRLNQLDAIQEQALLDSLNYAEELLLNFYPDQQ